VNVVDLIVNVRFVLTACIAAAVVLAMLGMLSPASRGALMTAGIFVFMFMGFVAMLSLLFLILTWVHLCNVVVVVSWCS